jgi:hypothetical protein
MRTLDLAWDDLRAAVRWLQQNGRRESSVRLGSAIWPHIWIRGHIAELPQLGLGSTIEDVDPALIGRQLWLSAAFAFEQGDHARAVEEFDRSIAALRASNDEVFLPWAHTLRAAARPAADTDAAVVVDALTFALDRFVALGSQFGQGMAHANLGSVERQRGNIAQSIHRHRELLDIATRLEMYSMVGLAHTHFGITHLTTGDLPKARESLAAAIAVYRSHVYWEGLAFCLGALTALAIIEGDPHRTVVAFGAAEGLRHRLNMRHWPHVTWIINDLKTSVDAIDDPDLQATRAASRPMDPLAAATIALRPAASTEAMTPGR